MKKTISIYIDCQVLDDLKAQAYKEMRPLSNMIEYIIRQYLEKIDKS